MKTSLLAKAGTCLVQMIHGLICIIGVFAVLDYGDRHWPGITSISMYVLGSIALVCYFWLFFCVPLREELRGDTGGSK